MKERAITYSPEMVLARLAGRKTNTRRIARMQPRDGLFSGRQARAGRVPFDKSPYGVPGDRLWVRENHRITWFDTEGCQAILRGYYTAGEERFDIKVTRAETELFRARTGKLGKTVPGRFMYRSLSRGLDEVVSVHLERVQEISEVDARAEGVKAALWFEPAGKPPSEHYHVDGVLATRRRSYRNGFATLWERIHGPGAWARNEWVWVVKFRRLE